MDSTILIKINDFVKNRLMELSGILLVLSSIFLLLSIASYSPSDPNFIYTPENIKIANIGGFYGSVISDFLLQAMGIISFLVVLNLLASTPKEAFNPAIVFPLYDVCQTTPILALRIVLASLLSVGTA